MDWLAQIDLQKFLLFTLVLTRVSGLVMIAPVYGAPEVPVQVRALFAFALSLLIAPTQWDVPVPYPGTVLSYLVLIGGELLVGLSLGLAVVVLFSGVQLAGQMIGRISGLILADVFDPSTGTSVPVFSRMLFLVTIAVFVSIGGHRIVMAGLLDTFRSIPPGSSAIPTSMAETFATLVQESFVLAIRAAAPVVTSLLLSTLVMGLISRTLPQLNILAVGFGMNSMLALGVMALSLGAAAWVFQDQLESAMEILLDALDAPLQTEWLA